MKKIKMLMLSLLLGMAMLAGCVSAGIGIGGHGVGAGVHPLGGYIYAD